MSVATIEELPDTETDHEVVRWSGSRWRVTSQSADGEFVRLVRLDRGDGALSSRGDILRISASAVERAND